MDKFPNIVIEGFPVKIEPGLSLLSQVFFIHILGLKPRMISAWEPECGITFHAMIPHHNVFYDIHSMAYMKISVGIWRGEEDRERGFIGINLRRKVSFPLPHGIHF